MASTRGIGSALTELNKQLRSERQVSPVSLRLVNKGHVIDPDGSWEWEKDPDVDDPFGDKGDNLGDNNIRVGGAGAGSSYDYSDRNLGRGGRGGGVDTSNWTERQWLNNRLLLDYQITVEDYEVLVEIAESTVNPFDAEIIVEILLELYKLGGNLARVYGKGRLKKLLKDFDKLSNAFDELVELLPWPAKFGIKFVKVFEWVLLTGKIVIQGDIHLEDYLDAIPFLIGDLIKLVIAQNCKTQAEFDKAMKQGLIDLLKKRFAEYKMIWNKGMEDAIMNSNFR